VDLYRIRPHRLGALKGEMEASGGVDVSSKNWHSKESNSGPFWHAGRVLSVFVMGDLDLAVRGRTYREPEGPHSMVVRGRDLDAALQHLAARDDCRSIAVVGLPEQVPDLSPIVGRRLLLVDGDSGRLRDFAEVAIRAGIEVEWVRSARPPFERLAAALLPVGGIVLAAGSSSRMSGPQKLLLDIDGVPMVRHVYEAASEGGCHQTVVVYGDDEVKRAVNGNAEIVFNPKARTGMASSLQAGLRAMRPEIEGAMVLLGDQPLVGSRTVATLLRAWRREGSRPAVAVSQGDGAWTPPIILGRELWEELLGLKGDAGARQVLQGRPELLDMVPAPGRPDDIDTPDDYAKIVRLFPRKRPRVKS
jgi:molybdenum cofactor cytidylyltransferase